MKSEYFSKYFIFYIKRSQNVRIISKILIYRIFYLDNILYKIKNHMKKKHKCETIFFVNDTVKYPLTVKESYQILAYHPFDSRWS